MGRNTVGKGEIARYEQFLLFPHSFQKACFPGASKGVTVWEWVKVYAIESFFSDQQMHNIVVYFHLFTVVLDWYQCVEYFHWEKMENKTAKYTDIKFRYKPTIVLANVLCHKTVYYGAKLS